MPFLAGVSPLWELTVPGRLPGKNELVEAASSHGDSPADPLNQYGPAVREQLAAVATKGRRKRRRWTRYNALKSRFEEDIRVLIRAKRLPKITVPVIAHWMFRIPDRRRDPSNLITGHHLILDAMQPEWLPNDNQMWIRRPMVFDWAVSEPEGLTLTLYPAEHFE